MDVIINQLIDLPELKDLKNNLQRFSCQDLLMNIISFDKITCGDFMEIISSFGYTSLNSFRTIIVSIVNFEKYLSSKNIRDEESILNMRNDFLTSINGLIWNAKCLPLSFLKNESVVFLIINENDSHIDLKMFSETIKETIKKLFPDISVNIGISNLHNEFPNIKRSYIEAEKALKFLKAEYSSDEVIFYSNIKSYKIITELKNINLLKEYYDDTVGKLDKYDAQNSTNFSNILYVFLKQNGNCIQAAQKLYLHRNTLMYKINKIQEIIKSDLTDADVKFEFYLGYMIKHINNF